MKSLPIVLFFILTAIAAIHVYWAFGGVWPVESERRLIDTVVGNADMASMPSMADTLVIAALLFTTALIALWAGGLFGHALQWLAKLAAAAIGAVFLARGVAGYFFEDIAWTPVEPFASLNLWLYSPFCLAIGVAFFILVLTTPNRGMRL